jgi:tetratricopeptide (TPR) repeat protein
MKMFRFHSPAAEPTRKKKRVPQDSAEWREEALAAEENGDWSRAVVCFRRALGMAPFCLEVREAFEDALEEQIFAEGVSLEQVLQSMAEVEAAVADEQRLARDFDEFGASDDQVAEFQEELVEEEPERATRAPAKAAPRRAKTATTPARQPAWWTGRRLGMAGAFAVAVLLTAGTLFSVVAAASYVRDALGGRSLPELTSSNELPSEVSAIVSDAGTLLQQGKASQAVETLRGARVKYPDHAEVLVPSLVQALRVLGNEELRSRDYADAAAAFREATEADPQNSLNWIDLGRALRNQARSNDMAGQPSRQREVLAEAEESFHRALALSTNDSVALYGLAQVYDAKNDRNEAVKTYEKLVAVAPSTFEGQMAKTALAQLKRR